MLETIHWIVLNCILILLLLYWLFGKQLKPKLRLCRRIFKFRLKLLSLETKIVGNLGKFKGDARSDFCDQLYAVEFSSFSISQMEEALRRYQVILTKMKNVLSARG